MLMSLLYASSALLLFGGVGTAITLNEFYLYGKDNNDFRLTRSDDGFSTPFKLDSPFPFFHKRNSELFVNNNGILSFDKGFGKFIPRKFPLKDYPLIAPFWADVDTTGPDGGEVLYRETTNKSLIIRAVNEITTAFHTNHRGFEPKSLFIATWYKVGHYRNQTCLNNTFQCILVTNGTTSFAIFNYAKDEIQWTTGDASGGRCGFGGAAAQVGFNAGDGVNFASVPGSRTREIINITNTTNVNIPGVWIFRVDGDIEPPPPPLPSCLQCRNDLSVSFSIEPRNGSLLGGTAVHLQGPCFTKCDTIKCMFEGKENVTGIVLNKHTAICVSPPFKSVGWKSLTLFITGVERERKFEGNHFGRFYSVYPHDTSDVTIGQDNKPILVKDPEETDEVDKIFTVHWNPRSFLPQLDPNSFMVNIELYELDFEMKEWMPFMPIEMGTPNDGIANFAVPESGRNEIDVYAVAIRISVGSPSPQARTFVDILEYAKDNVTQWKTDLFYAESLDLFNRCMAWHKEEDSFDISTTIHELVPCCSETKDKADDMNSGLVRDYRDKLVALLNPNADFCYLQKTPTSANSTLGQQCCYNDSNGYLITGPNSGGTVNLFSPVGHSDYDMYIDHLMGDIIPAISCCKAKYRSATCRLFYERRESKINETCKLPPPGMTIGDPHIVTMDNFMYTFNGLGEFVLIETVNDIFTLQGRLIQSRDTYESLISTSQYSAIVARQFDSDTVQFQNADNDEIDALINGEVFDFEGLLEQQFNNVTLKKTSGDVVTLSAVFSSGVHIEVKAKHKMLFSLYVSLPNNSDYWSKTSGLMGNYNGDKSDDLLPRGGTVAIPDTSSIKEIHHKFGMTWIISRPQDSLFTYSKGYDWTKYNNSNFVPLYDTNFRDPNLEMDANDICEGDIYCLFDIAATGNVELGNDTRQGIIDRAEILNRSQQVILCDPPCENGVCVENDTCSCSEGFSGPLCTEFSVTECKGVMKDFCNYKGKCAVKGVSATCICDDGHSGIRCEEEDDEDDEDYKQTDN